MASSRVRIFSGCSISKILTIRRFSRMRDPTATSGSAFHFTPDREEENFKKERQNRNHKNTQHENWTPPQPTSNRPLSGERPFFNPTNDHNPQSQPTGGNGPPHQSNGLNNVSDDAFLRKFKLRPENSKSNHPSASAASTTTAKPPSSDPPPDAHDIFKKMKETGLIPNAVAMLDGLCKDGLVQDAMKLFASMREKGTIPEVVIYTAVVDGFCKAHKPDDAKRIFAKMQANAITPNAFTYSLLIQGLCKCNRMDDAVDFCHQMLEAGHSPNLTTFVGLVDGLSREKGVEEAHTVVTTLRQKGFYVPDKAVREFLDKNSPFPSPVWEAIFGKKASRKPS